MKNFHRLILHLLGIMFCCTETRLTRTFTVATKMTAADVSVFRNSYNDRIPRRKNHGHQSNRS